MDIQLESPYRIVGDKMLERVLFLLKIESQLIMNGSTQSLSLNLNREHSQQLRSTKKLKLKDDLPHEDDLIPLPM